MFDIAEELSKLPKKPGVYLMHDSADNIIYVGKAKNLFNRVRSYFRAYTKKTVKIQKMVTLIDHFEYIITDSELEAFVLENNLIKEYSPKYNTLLKDGKTYPYIKVTMGDEYPRIMMVRKTWRDKGKYYGPYANFTAVIDIIDLLNSTYALRTCGKKLVEGECTDRPCLNYSMGKCTGPCGNKISREDYLKQVDSALDFLNGNDKTLIRDLKEKMEQASERMDYEEALKYRGLLESAGRIIERQKITDSDGEDRDIIAVASDDQDAVVQVFFIRNGKMIGREHYHLGEITGSTDQEILSDFVKRFYAGTPFIPKEIMLQYTIEDEEMISNWLSGVKGKKVRLINPKIGTKEKLIELAAKNAMLVLAQDKEKLIREEQRTLGAARDLAKLLSMDQIVRMEAFDISNISGFENVGSMVVFENGKSLKSDYRKFKIRTVAGPDDYACMHEVLNRRFVHGLEERVKLSENSIEDTYGSFSRFPDLIMMDGGRGQVNIAKQVLEELHLDIPVCGMVKDDNHRTRGLYVDGVEIDIDRHSAAFELITRIQDEAHRFAIEYHRSLRSKKQVKSILDDIPGVGPARRKALMRAFSSVEDIKQATEEQLAAVDEIPKDLAKTIFNFFRQ